MKLVRTPPRRDSIEDHIATARAFLQRAGIDADATRPWVRDLAYEGLIDGPKSEPKGVGRGRRERYSPRDYGDLIEVMRVRAQGAIHRSTWLVWLWLRGREYPVATAREALASDLRRNLRTVRRQFAPTGRNTEPFVVKFRRNVAPQKATSPFPDFGPLEEPLAALMFRPNEAKDVPLDLDALVGFAAEALGVGETQFRSAMEMGLAAPQDDTGAALRAFSDALPQSEFATLVRTFADAAVDLFPPPQLAGMLDDGFGHAGVERALERATDEDLRRIRTLVRNIRTGEFETAVLKAREAVPPEGKIAITMLSDWTRFQRWLWRGSPEQNAYLFCTYLASDGPPIPPELRERIDVDGVLRTLRDQHGGTGERTSFVTERE